MELSSREKKVGNREQRRRIFFNMGDRDRRKARWSKRSRLGGLFLHESMPKCSSETIPHRVGLESEHKDEKRMEEKETIGIVDTVSRSKEQGFGESSRL